MTQGVDLPAFLWVLLAALLGGLLGAACVGFLFSRRIERRLRWMHSDLMEMTGALQDRIAGLGRVVQQQKGTGRAAAGIGVGLGEYSWRADHETARDPAGRADSEGARPSERQRDESTQPEQKWNLRRWLECYSSDPTTFQERSGAKAVSVRKSGSGASTSAAVYEHPNGRFLLFDADGREWVIPKAGLRIDDTSYYDTGIRDLFNCPGHQSSRAYTFTVEQPALVNREGDSWLLAADGKGRLKLRPEAGA